MTYRSTRYQTLAEVLTRLNQALAGWANYFRYGVSKAVFGAVDHHAWGRLMRWTRRKYEGRNRLGMPEMKRRFCGQGWRFAQGKVVFTGASSVTVKRYRYRGSNIPTPGPRNQKPPPAAADPTGKTRGAPGALRGARRVREGACGKRTAATPKPRPQAYLTLHPSGPSLSCPHPSNHASPAPPPTRRKTAMPAVTRRDRYRLLQHPRTPPGRTWLIRLRRGHQSVITTIGLSRASAEHLPRKITDLLAEPERKSLDRHRSIDLFPRERGARQGMLTLGSEQSHTAVACCWPDRTDEGTCTLVFRPHPGTGRAHYVGVCVDDSC